METARLLAHFESQRLLQNARILAEKSKPLKLIPMLKANGYGHGALWVAQTLLSQNGIRESLYALGTATIEEALELRQKVPETIRLIVFSGTTPWGPGKGQICLSSRLDPAITTIEDFRLFLSGGWASKLDYHLKFNTGMNRLGIPLTSADLLDEALELLRQRPAREWPRTVYSHLAQSDEPGTALSKRQLDRFVRLREKWRASRPETEFHLGNSGGIWNHKAWKLKELTHHVRPGLALFGIEPWAGAPAYGLQPVLRLEARVMTRLHLKKGEQIGYGGAFTIGGSLPSTKASRWAQSKATSGKNFAILPCGYADGIPRLLGNYGRVALADHLGNHPKMEAIVGIVSMDLMAISCQSETKVGDLAQILGPNISAWDQALAARTVPYELLTGLTARVQRLYE